MQNTVKLFQFPVFNYYMLTENSGKTGISSLFFAHIFQIMQDIPQWPYTGGLEILGSKFCIVFFCLLRPYYLHKGGGKCNEPSGKVNKGPKSMPTLTQNADFTLLFAILHEIPIAPKRPLSR